MSDPARERFLAPLRARLAEPAAPSATWRAEAPQVQAASPPGPAPVPVPTIGYRNLDPDDLLGTFAAAATAAGAVVHLVAGSDPDRRLLAELVTRERIERAVVAPLPELRETGRRLERQGVVVRLDAPDGEDQRAARAGADLGVTSATALVAATGSVVLRATASTSRSVSLLPRVHLVVAPATRLVPTPGSILRAFDGQPRLLPSNLVFVTGPSRTGDIEQLLTVGVHGPHAVHIVITGV